MKGYKVFNPDWTCRGFQYEVGKTYEENISPECCKRGFHFCQKISDCFGYYDFNPENKVAEVGVLGEVSFREDSYDTKGSTNKIRIVREITWQEVLDLANTGSGCDGYGNTGDYNRGSRNVGRSNSGSFNTGDNNSGHRNSGCDNIGSFNTGCVNIGSCNTGSINKGYRNSGGYNFGDENSGDSNLGWANSGDFNVGDHNTGNFNTGHRNTGDWNLSSEATGCFNTKSQKIKFFDKETNLTFERWRSSEAYSILSQLDLRPLEFRRSDKMTEKEKSEYPDHEITGRYLRERTIDTDYRAEWWRSLTKEERDIIRAIPNFDPDKFRKITGIDTNAAI